MKLKLWGTRGSVPAPGSATARYGGNTSCAQVTLSDGTTLVLDAGTGIRPLGAALADDGPVHILLTHLHLDHIQGLLFFAPLFRTGTEVAIWGPAQRDSLERRIGRYLSAPLSPVELRELPCGPSFHTCPPEEWEIGPARVRAQFVVHRGPTLGYRIEEDGAVLTYIPDHEPALGGPIGDYEDEWISGFALAHEASLLVHDAQYTDDEYRSHRGWGHSAVGDALAFAERVRASRTLLFHHDPLHDDDALDELAGAAERRWAERMGERATVALAAEGEEIEV